MYNNFFGFRERPFKLVPNPAYLFLSRSHEEALAHLNYAVAQGDGFVLITGEVGTGKTTLCRSFLETLDETAKTAYVFNPKLDAVQLLKAINDEFGIDAASDTIKGLTDALNAFLIEQKRCGKKVLILIDEAQNLTRDVLEQLRLLSNLETTQDKLMQIILVGQPELGEMLDSTELRQLGQRITLSCHLRPFDLNETRAYMSHRLNIASLKSGPEFTKGAIAAVYRYSGGIPRLINIVCDRALLTAFGLDAKVVKESIVLAAIRELSGRGRPEAPRFPRRRQMVLAGTAICAAALLFFVDLPFRSRPAEEMPAPKRSAAESPSPVPAAELSTEPARSMEVSQAPRNSPAAAEESAGKPPNGPAKMGLKAYIAQLDEKNSRQNALDTAMSMWADTVEIKPYLMAVQDDRDFFRLAAKQNGFRIQQVVGDLPLVEKLNLPAVLLVRSPDSVMPVYVTLIRLKENLATLKARPGDPGIQLSMEALSAHYAGMAYIPWKNFFDFSGVLPANAGADAIVTLKMHLRDLGYDHIEISPVYDDAARKAVQHLQRAHGLEDDGLVGPLTKIILYNQINRLHVPLIAEE